MHFLNPDALWGLLGMAIPVLIHLFNFQRPVKVLFSNTRILRDVIQKTNKTRSVRNWLLLATRMLAIGALALAFAQPQSGKRSETEARAGSGSQLVFIDNSSSMYWPDDGNRAIEKAQAIARSQPLPSSGRGWYALLTLDFLSRHTWTSARSFTDQTVDVRPSFESRSLETVIRRASRQAAFSPDPAQARIHLISDFQKAQAGDPATWPLDSGRTWVLHPVPHKATFNTWVDSVWLSRPLSAGDREPELRIRIGHPGGSEGKPARLQVLVNRNLVGGQVLRLGPGRHSEARVRIRTQGNSILKTEVVLDDPEIGVDNRFYLVLNPPRPLPVFHLTDAPGSPVQKAFGAAPWFRYTSGSPANPDFKSLEKAGFIVMETRSEPGPGLRDEILRRVREGAALCLVPRNDVSWIPAFAEQAGLKISPASAGEAPARYAISLPGQQDPFFTDAFQNEGGNRRKPFALPLLDLPGAGSVLRYESGSGFAIRAALGDGQVFVLAAAFSEETENLSRHPLMIPLFYRMAFSAQGSEQQTLYAGPGTTGVEFPSDSLTTDGREWQVELVKGNEKWSSVLRSTGKLRQLQIPGEGMQPGFWDVVLEGKVLGTIACNADKRESDPEFYSASVLKNMLAGKPWVQVEGVEQNASPDHIQAGHTESWPWWKWLLALAFAAVVAEIFLMKRDPAAAPAAG